MSQHAAAGAEFGEQRLDATADVIANRADLLDREPGRIGQVPVEITLAGVDRAGVAAAHGDHNVGSLHLVSSKWLGELSGDVEADLGHGLDDGGVELAGGL